MSSTDPLNQYSSNTFEKIAETTMHYGFIPIKSPRVSKEDVAISKKLEDPLSPDTLSEKVALMRMFVKNKFYEKHGPGLFYYPKPFRGKQKGHRFSLDIVGSNESISDALLIQATKASLEAEGFKNVIVDINSMGERDTVEKFERELHTYLRKHIDNIPDKWRAVFQKNTLEITTCTDNLCESFVSTAPPIVNFLSDSARKHFKEVLEYLESADIDYRINYKLLSNKHIGHHTVFSIRDEKDEIELARGYRYGKICKKLGSKKDHQGITSLISYEHAKPKIKLVRQTNKTPKFYFIHLGPTARLKGLKILEILRRANISTQHALTKEKIGGQMSHAQKSGARYLIIMGQKEAYEDSIVVRDMSNWKQETVPISDLPKLIRQYK